MLTLDLDSSISDDSGDTTSTLPDMSSLSDVEEAPLDKYNRLRLEYGALRLEHSKYSRPDLRRVYWQKLPPLNAAMAKLKSQINALEILLKDQLL